MSVMMENGMMGKKNETDVDAMTLPRKNETMVEMKKCKNVCAKLSDALPDWVSLSGMKQTCDDSVPIWWRSIWLLVVLVGLVFSAYQIITQVEYFMERPITVRISMKSLTEMTFPPITFCNFNPARYSALVERNLTDISPLLSGVISQGLPIGGNITMSDYSGQFDETIDWETTYYMIAHRLKDMLVKCEWKHEKCTEDNFEVKYSDAGVCFTFNADMKQYVQTSGSSGGALKLLLNIEQYEYLPGTMLAGIEVLIEEKSQPPLVGDHGVRVPVGRWTNIVMHRNVIVHLEPPWENCTKADDEHGHEDGREMCNFRCYSEAVIRNCSCQLLHMKALPEHGDVRICDPAEAYFCASMKTNDIQAGHDECADSCQTQACIEEDYELMTSEAPFSEQYLAELGRLTNMTKKEAKENLVGFEVYYRDMAEQQINNTVAYSPFDLFCDIGGALGLVLGASIATVFEFIDFCFREKYKSYHKKS